MVRINIKKVIFISVGILFFFSNIGLSQTDSLGFANGELVIGSIKKMDRSVITIETDFSNNDFSIDWDKVNMIKSDQNYLVTLSDGRRFDAKINSTGNDKEVEIFNEDGSTIVSLDDIVYFNPINQSFWDKFNANIDIGLNLTKANNLTQFNARTGASYLTKRWALGGTYNTVFSSQDSVSDTRRMDSNVNFKVFLPKDWYTFISNDFLQNDEQKLKLRSTTKLGIGNYLVHTNSSYLGIFGGAALNNEKFTENANPDRQSTEVFAGLELNLFDIGDLSLLTNTIVFPSLSEDGRVRVDFKFDVKYDLPLDLYIKVGTTVNYDNQPIAGAGDLDYVFQTGIGWSW